MHALLHHPRRMISRHLRTRSRGQSLVEMALILPVFMLLMVAALDLGRIYYSRITVNDAAREGALEAARNPGSFLANTACTTANKDSNRIMCRSLNEARGSFVTVLPADVSRTCSTLICPPLVPALGDSVYVTVTGRFTFLTPLLGQFFGGQTVTFTSRASAQLNVMPTAFTTPTPTSSFTAIPTTGQAPLTVAFVNTSTSGTSWNWNFGDGQSSTAQNPVTHLYATAGSYGVTLTTTNAAGSATSAMTVITVSAPTPAAPVADFTATPQSGSAPLLVTFANTSTGVPTTWAWTFGDGTTSSLATPPPKTYASTGSFTVTLTVTNAGGSSTISKVISTSTACVTPVANFSLNQLTGKKRQATFVATDSSLNMGTAGCNNIWSWNFGDGSGQSSIQNPPGYVYNSAGTYTITLGASNSAGTSSKSIVVVVTP